MITILILAVWLISAMWLSTIAMDMMSASNSIENIMGLLLLVLTIGITIKTKCLTKLKNLWKK